MFKLLSKTVLMWVSVGCVIALLVINGLTIAGYSQSFSDYSKTNFALSFVLGLIMFFFSYKELKGF